MKDNILIAYYTWSGNTGHLASIIQRESGGRLFELQPLEPSPKVYAACVKQAKKEIYAGNMPELKAIPDKLDDYDTVVVGSPIWWYTMAPPAEAFLSRADLSGKKIAPLLYAWRRRKRTYNRRC